MYSDAAKPDDGPDLSQTESQYGKMVQLSKGTDFSKRQRMHNNSKGDPSPTSENGKEEKSPLTNFLHLAENSSRGSGTRQGECNYLHQNIQCKGENATPVAATAAASDLDLRTMWKREQRERKAELAAMELRLCRELAAGRQDLFLRFESLQAALNQQQTLLKMMLKIVVTPPAPSVVVEDCNRFSTVLSSDESTPSGKRNSEPVSQHELRVPNPLLGCIEVETCGKEPCSVGENTGCRHPATVSSNVTNAGHTCLYGEHMVMLDSNTGLLKEMPFVDSGTRVKNSGEDFAAVCETESLQVPKSHSQADIVGIPCNRWSSAETYLGKDSTLNAKDKIKACGPDFTGQVRYGEFSAKPTDRRKSSFKAPSPVGTEQPVRPEQHYKFESSVSSSSRVYHRMGTNPAQHCTLPTLSGNKMGEEYTEIPVCQKQENYDIRAKRDEDALHVYQNHRPAAATRSRPTTTEDSAVAESSFAPTPRRIFWLSASDENK